MGNLCGKEAAPDPLAENARPLNQDASSRPNQSSSVPRKVGGPPRTLGSGAPGPASQEDARKKAAEAAEVRAVRLLPDIKSLKANAGEIINAVIG